MFLRFISWFFYRKQNITIDGMKIVNLLRGGLVLILAPALAGLVSITAIIMVVVFKKTAKDVQFLPQTMMRIVSKVAGVKVAVSGVGKLDRLKPYIFAVNHQSQFDIFALQGYLGFDFRWLAKKELFKVPVFGYGMQVADYIPVDRSRGRQALKSLEEAAKRIAAGASVIIFPEGTRSPDGKLHDFKPGAMVLAIKAGVPLVPMAILGTHQVLPKGKLLAKPGKVEIRVGDPIETRSYTVKQKQELAELLHSRVAELIGGEN